ncbi:200 kDa antigen p200, putative [Burkholderia pseudomallei 1710b]|uniref:200 kDa antigen p200, putative n=1 Tax=Burkholderia pseudomallei (strain 1710b) TaxID=320372 RepID=Q3JL22_BURP1|nr:200 kDa antigen p200, putative [Burkholderia pseudomallei 1710b]
MTYDQLLLASGRSRRMRAPHRRPLRRARRDRTAPSARGARRASARRRCRSSAARAPPCPSADGIGRCGTSAGGRPSTANTRVHTDRSPARTPSSTGTPPRAPSRIRRCRSRRCTESGRTPPRRRAAPAGRSGTRTHRCRPSGPAAPDAGPSASRRSGPRPAAPPPFPAPRCRLCSRRVASCRHLVWFLQSHGCRRVAVPSNDGCHITRRAPGKISQSSLFGLSSVLIARSGRRAAVRRRAVRRTGVRRGGARWGVVGKGVVRAGVARRGHAVARLRLGRSQRARLGRRPAAIGRLDLAEPDQHAHHAVDVVVAHEAVAARRVAIDRARERDVAHDGHAARFGMPNDGERACVGLAHRHERNRHDVRIHVDADRDVGRVRDDEIGLLDVRLDLLRQQFLMNLAPLALDLVIALALLVFLLHLVLVHLQFAVVQEVFDGGVEDQHGQCAQQEQQHEAHREHDPHVAEQRRARAEQPEHVGVVETGEHAHREGEHADIEQRLHRVLRRAPAEEPLHSLDRIERGEIEADRFDREREAALHKRRQRARRRAEQHERRGDAQEQLRPRECVRTRVRLRARRRDPHEFGRDARQIDERGRGQRARGDHDERDDVPRLERLPLLRRVAQLLRGRLLGFLGHRSLHQAAERMHAQQRRQLVRRRVYEVQVEHGERDDALDRQRQRERVDLRAEAREQPEQRIGDEHHDQHGRGEREPVRDEIGQQRADARQIDREQRAGGHRRVARLERADDRQHAALLQERGRVEQAHERRERRRFDARRRVDRIADRRAALVVDQFAHRRRDPERQRQRDAEHDARGRLRQRDAGERAALQRRMREARPQPEDDREHDRVLHDAVDDRPVVQERQQIEHRRDARVRDRDRAGVPVERLHQDIHRVARHDVT